MKQHRFIPRRDDSWFVGPANETCHLCGCDPRNIVHEGLDDELQPRFHSHIPGGTYCESCGHLRHAHVDDHCVSKPIRSRAKRDDESVVAQRDAALASVLALARVIRKVGGYLPVADQDALREAEALCVEVKG